MYWRRKINLKKMSTKKINICFAFVSTDHLICWQQKINNKLFEQTFLIFFTNLFHLHISHGSNKTA